MTKHHKVGYDVCATDCGCPEDGNVTNEELQQACAFLWMVVCRDCQETAVRVTPERFARYVSSIIEIDYNIVNEIINESFANYDFSNFVTQQQLVDAINAIDIPPAGPTADEVDIAITNALNTALADYSTTTEINQFLQNYYTQTQINALFENQQTQITTLSNQVQSLQAQLDACDCDGGGTGGGGPTTTPPSIDSPLVNLTDNTCPQCLNRVVTNPDNFNIGVGVTGNGVVTVRVDNVVVSNIADFVVSDGATLEICLTGNEGENVVGGISLYYIDDGNNLNIDGLSYNVTCPTTQTNSAPTSQGSLVDITENEGVAFDVDMSGCFADADNDTLTYAITPQPLPAGFTFDTTTGLLSSASTTPAGTYSLSVIANDGEFDSPPCTINIEIEAAIVQGSITADPNASLLILQQGQTVPVEDTRLDINADGTFLFNGEDGNFLYNDASGTWVNPATSAQNWDIYFDTTGAASFDFSTGSPSNTWLAAGTNPSLGIRENTAAQNTGNVVVHFRPQGSGLAPNAAGTTSWTVQLTSND